MDARELRLGNWVLTPTTQGGELIIPDRPLQLTAIWLYGDLEFTVPPNGRSERILSQFCEGIPLTKEWLLKLGFELSASEYWYNGVNIIPSRSEFYFAVNGREFGEPIKYVHQLQNLIFALTGEELTIKQQASV